MPPARIEKAKTVFWRDEEGIVRCAPRPDTIQDHTLADAEAFIAAIATLGEGERVLVLANMSQVKSVDRQARAHFASPEAIAVARAVALVVASQISRVIGSFFIRINKPPYPVKLFTSEGDARDWLVSLR